ncbi:MAG: diguanylate phosphodiesterase, partial [Deltaproteobacteria bacterium]
MSDEKNIFSRAEEFMQLFKKGADFTQELLKENERLRFKVVQLEEENRLVKMSGADGSDKLAAELNKKLQSLKEEMHKLMERHRAVEAENKDFANRYLEIEYENN